MSKNIFFASAISPLNGWRTKISNSLVRVWCIVFSLLTVSVMYAQEEGVRLLPDGGLEFPAESKYISNSISGGTAWAINANITTPFVRQDETSRRYRNVISFYLNESQPTHYLDDFTASVDLLIEYKALYTESSYHSFTKTLTLEYKKGEGQLSDVRKYIHFEGAEEVKVTVTGYSFPPAAGDLNFENILLLENALIPIRYYDISTSPFTLGTPVIADDVLNVGWTPPANPGNNAIQLEWAWLENELESNYHIGETFTVASKEKLMKTGATRVELGYAAPGYSIPLLYDGLGKLHYRVRGVSIKSTGTRVYGPWSAINSVDYNGHESGLNWQVTTSFAEEGKHKTVIQYYDGSLRSRQTVTKDNTTLNTVIAETLYDHEGRPAVQVLPAPGMSNAIAYRRNLNKFNSPEGGMLAQANDQNPADFFDHYFSGATTPTLQDTVPGSAAEYYSSQNPTASTTGKFIADAEGYPYTVTRYTPDGTGRIQSQSGVGAAMKMGSGRETKYYYGSPKQEELDGLFGTEVGDKSHYFKNMVQDANGQMSVSYVDMHGRTIATALAGEAPANLSPLNVSNALFYPGQHHTSALTLNLLDSNTNITKGNTIESVSSLLVPYRTAYSFEYKLTPESLSLPTCEPATPICYECLYDLEFAVIDESRDKEQPVIFKRYNNLSVDMDTSCVSPTRLFQNLDSIGLVAPQSTIFFSDTLNPGSYSIRKTLTISEKSLELLKAHYLTKNECYLDRQIIFDSVYAVLKDSSRCDEPPVANPEQASCDACRIALGDSTSYADKYLASINRTLPITDELKAEINAAYKAAKKNCDLVCGITPLETITKREMMLADMKPFYGQYAKESYLGVNTMTTKYNIFANNKYRSPKDVNGVDPGHYLTETGQVDLSINDILPTVTPADFDAAFQDKWAEALLPYHPEYQRLLFAEQYLEESYNWVSNFYYVPTFSIAQDSGFLFTSTASLTAKDPFFTVPGIGTTRLNNMRTKLEMNYKEGMSMWQYAYAMAICKKMSPGSTPCRNPNDPTPAFAIPKTPVYPSLSAADKDSIWVAFKGLYLQERRVMMDEFVASTVTALSNADHDALIAQGFILHFTKNPAEQVKQAQNNSEDTGNWDYWPPTAGGDPVLPPDWNTPGAEQAGYTSQCQSYIGMWEQALKKCPALTALPNHSTILASLTTRMVEICRKGSSDFSPRGASSVAPTTPYDGAYRNFETLIKDVFDSLGIATTDLCNPFVIEYPRAYGMGRKAAPSLVTTIDSCNCNKYATIKAAAVLAGVNTYSLSQMNAYLNNLYGDTLTASMYYALERCNELSVPRISNCDTVYNVVSAPCNSMDPCGYGAHRMVQPLLLMQGDSIVMSRAELPLMEEQPCRPGMVWDPIWGCIDGPVGPIDCIWDEALNWCTGPGPGGCPIGYEWDYFTNRCIPAIVPDPDCDFNCIVSVTCDTTYVTVIALDGPSPMPDFMQCGYSEPPAPKCYTCTDIKGLISSFKTYFTAPYNEAPYAGTGGLDTTQVNYLKNLARYINYKTGMNYTWLDYMQAIDSADCNLDAGGTQTVICRNTTPLSEATEIFTKPDPCQQTHDQALDKAELIYNFRLKQILKGFEDQYRAKCMAAAKLESFTVSFIPKEYHYTLYYYDQAGNLVKTVPPAGVRPDYSAVFLASVRAKRNQPDAEIATPNHVLLTEYRYNSLNQVVAQKSPDGGKSKFWYDKLGRLGVSQNAKQLTSNQYSYTKYDPLGRITEVGQAQNTTAMLQTTSQDATLLAAWISGASVRDQLTQTVYDNEYSLTLSDPAIGAKITQRNLRNRVSYTAVKKLSTDAWYDNATFYTYDIHGNVDTLLQDYRGLHSTFNVDRFKRISYRYDLVSGKVNEVAYQGGSPDAFYHRYYYDAENRITSVYTSRDSIYWERDAAYEYYKHGPLSRMKLGKNDVQGVDYAYTIQGWLKGINSSNLNPALDMGGDGDGLPTNSAVARDIFGFGLHYYDSGTELDYKAIGGGTGSFARPNNGANFKSLYNGNIAAMTVNNGGLTKGAAGSTNALPLMYNYQYDQLNRLVAMRAYQGLNEATNTWAPVAIDDYQETVSYDANGNIKSYVRNGAPSIAGKQMLMDNLGYNYDTATNQLNHVADNVNAANYIEDIDGQDVNNYRYDAIGNLIKDVSEGITDINWTVYGKIAAITKNSGNISYTYDASGNRITKTAAGKTTLYVRDASGNVMSVYEIPAVNTVKQKELHLYGRSRMGMAFPESRTPDNSTTLAIDFGNAIVRTLVRGEKIFELSNHLGNVLVTISDKKIQIPKASPNQTQIDSYEADVVTATDYAPFGMQLFGRTHSASSSKYRYGFNGKERDTEIASTTTYDYGFRIYNPALGKFLSVDPLSKSYPWYTPYQFAGNNPIKFIDLDGLEEADPAKALYADKPQIDMNGAPSGTPKNAQGFYRSHKYFWTQMLSLHPEYFSVDNVSLINSGYSPWVDEVWAKNFPGDASYMDNRLIHHHVEGKNMAVGIPEKMHWDKFGELHSYLNKAGKALRGATVSGTINGLANVFGVASDVIGLATDNPDALANNFSKGLPEDYIGRVVNPYYPSQGVYLVMDNVVKETTTRYNKKGDILQQFTSARYYSASIYSDYVWDKDEGRFRGVNLVATQTGVVRYNSSGEMVSEVMKRSDQEGVNVSGKAPEKDVSRYSNLY